MRRGTKDATSDCISLGWSDRCAKPCGKGGVRARDWNLGCPQVNSVHSTNSKQDTHNQIPVVLSHLLRIHWVCNTECNTESSVFEDRVTSSHAT
jgi:hypothetical protein